MRGFSFSSLVVSREDFRSDKRGPGARLGRGESTGEDGWFDLETADTAKGWPKGG